MLEINIKELLVISVIVLIIFCAGKLPEIGSALDKGIKNLKNRLTRTTILTIRHQRRKTKKNNYYSAIKTIQ